MPEGYDLNFTDEAAVLSLDLGKANAMDPRFFDALDAGLEEAEAGRPCGLVVTGAESHFCAGLNLVALRELDREGMETFMGRFRDVLLRLLEFPGRTVAAINGHAIAGGAILAATCDVRVASVGNYRIGVRETALGVGLPRCAMEVLRRSLCPDRLEEMVLSGKLYDPEEALEIGFANELVRPDRLLPASLRRATRDRAVVPLARAQIRRGVVAPWADAIRNGGDDSDWLDTWFSDDAQRLINEVVSRL